MAQFKARYLGDEAHAEWLGLGDTKAEIEQRATQAGINPANLQWENITPEQPTTTQPDMEQKFSNLVAQRQEQGIPFEPLAMTNAGIDPTSVDANKMPETTTDLTAGQGTDFTPPATQADSITSAYTGSMMTTLQTQRDTLEKAYQTQLDNIQKNLEASQKRQDELMAKQENILTGDVKDLTEPFRAETEESERERLKVEENYFANQQLVNELEGLLTDIQTDLQSQKDVTGLASIRNPRIQKSMEDAEARVGVIEATMAARNNQINVANNLIDRTVTAMTADRQDQLNYYNSLLNFYSAQSDTEGDKILQLTADEKNTIAQQTNLIEMDLAQTQANVDYIKGLMLDPSTAQIVAQSGVTLNDTPEQVNQKFAAFAYQEEVTSMNNSMEEQGYSYVATPQQLAGKDQANLAYMTDSKGKSRVYYKEPEIVVQGKSGGTIGGNETITVNDTEVELDNGNIVDISTVDGLKQAIANGYNPADLKKYLDENTKLTVGTVNSLMEEATAGTEVFITKDYLKDLFGATLNTSVKTYFENNYDEKEIKQKAKDAGYTAGGFLGFGVGDKGIEDFLNSEVANNEYLDYLMTTIEAYREAGYSDTQILKDMS